MDFYSQVRDLFNQCIAQDDKQGETGMEINSLKMGYNKTYGDCILGFYPAIMDSLKKVVLEENMQAKAIANHLEQTLNKWAVLIKKFVHSFEDQFALI